MRDIRVATVQFEHRDNDKAANWDRIAQLTQQAADRGAEVICFHECCTSGYTFLQHLNRQEMIGLAEPVPEGDTIGELIRIAQRHQVLLMAGLVERAGDPGDTTRQNLYNCYVAVDADGLVARHRKLHPFVNPHLTPGEGYTVFSWREVTFGILICYDNNLPENVRATTLLGAEVIAMPHVTGCLPSPMPGRGTVAAELWHNRELDPSRLRREFQGPKGREWLMKWLPSRAWENGIFALFANPIGQDADTIKPGLAMIVDPHGEVLAESSALDDDVVVCSLAEKTYAEASGRRYLRARRPELYGLLTAPHPDGTQPVTQPGWQLAYEKRNQQGE